jgi:hypothetical protein
MRSGKDRTPAKGEVPWRSLQLRPVRLRHVLDEGDVVPRRWECMLTGCVRPASAEAGAEGEPQGFFELTHGQSVCQHRVDPPRGRMFPAPGQRKPALNRRGESLARIGGHFSVMGGHVRGEYASALKIPKSCHLSNIRIPVQESGRL